MSKDLATHQEFANKTVRIATRESPLALWQANFIASQIRSRFPHTTVEICGMSTAGDRWLSAPLSEIGGKGLFIKELEVAMLQGEADIAVHSMKDLPAQLPDGFKLAAIGFRAPVEDAVVSPHGDFWSLPAGARVGSSSLRRQAQLLRLRPDLEFVPVRGNVDTRIGRIAEGEVDAVILALAGLQRLEKNMDQVHPLPVETSLPAPGQGALGIECVAGSWVEPLIAQLDDAVVHTCVAAERQVSLGLGADCSLPVAAYAQMSADDKLLELRALVGSERGTQTAWASARGEDPIRVGQTVVERLLDGGAQHILDSLRESK